MTEDVGVGNDAVMVEDLRNGKEVEDCEMSLADDVGFLDEVEAEGEALS